MRKICMLIIACLLILTLLPGYASANTADPSAIAARAAAPDTSLGQVSQMYEEYTVKRGDSLVSIGRQFGMPWRDIAKLNDIHGPMYTIIPGQIIKIPLSSSLLPSYLKKLRKDAVEVKTDKDFVSALKTARVIELKKDITLSGNSYTLDHLNALIIDEGVTLTITSLNFDAKCKIINFGEIIVADFGRIFFYREPDYAAIGKISTRGKDAKIAYHSEKYIVDEITYFLKEDSFFNSLYISAGSSKENPVEIWVNHDIVIPVGKTLWIGSGNVLHVSKGVTLKNNGFIVCLNEPIVDGKINGIGLITKDKYYVF